MDKYIMMTLLCVLSSFGMTLAQNNLGILHGEQGSADDANSSTGSYCLMYNPSFHELADSLQSAELLAIANLNDSHMCNTTEEVSVVQGKAAFVARGNCSFSEKAYVVQSLGAKALIIVSMNGLFEPVAGNDSDYDNINIPVALITDADFTSLLSLGVDVRVKLFSPPNPRIDWNLVVIWLLATGTVTVGAFWSGITQHKKYASKKRASQRAGRDESEKEEEDQDSLDMNPQTILVFVVLMCGMLVSLYFFYDYLVYVVIAMFTLASSTALYCTLKPLMVFCSCLPDTRIPNNKLPGFRRRPELRSIILFLLCAGVAIWWAVERNKSYAWILQDVLGVVFCVHMMRTVRLPSLMACSVLLVLLFVYDVFFVFITPLFTKSGESIMVDVATGGGSKSGEMLPMVLKVPRIAQSALSVCHLPYSLLGFGDMLVPGLLVGYCHGFDLKVGSRRVYFISTVTAYGVGLVMTFVALSLMNTGQPALLYLVPCTLLTTVFIGACRRELRHLWTGKLPGKQSKDNGNQSASINSDPQETGSQGSQAQGDCGNNSDGSDSEQPLLVAGSKYTDDN